MDDLDVLPDELRVRSINDQETVLNYPDALQAIHFLEAANWALLGWEGWLRYANGEIGFAMQYDDIDQDEGEAWDAFVHRSARICRTGIEQAQQRWSDAPQPSDAELFYCLTASDGTGTA